MKASLQKADRDVNALHSDLQIRLLQNAGMEKHHRLREARERIFATAKEAAESIGVPYGTYSGHEAGSRGMKEDALRLYARRFRVSFVWLAHGIGTVSDEDPSRLVVVGRISGAEIDGDGTVTPDTGDVIEVAVPVPEGAVGYEVIGNSMFPRYDPGDIIVVAGKGKPLAELRDGEEAVVRTIEGPRYLKRIRRTPEADQFDLESHNAPLLRGVRLDWASPVIVVIRPGQWTRVDSGGDVRAVKRAKRAA